MALDVVVIMKRINWENVFYGMVVILVLWLLSLIKRGTGSIKGNVLRFKGENFAKDVEWSLSNVISRFANEKRLMRKVDNLSLYDLDVAFEEFGNVVEYKKGKYKSYDLYEYVREKASDKNRDAFLKKLTR